MTAWYPKFEQNRMMSNDKNFMFHMDDNTDNVLEHFFIYNCNADL